MKTHFKQFLREKCNYQEKEINLLYRRMYKNGIKIRDINYINYSPLHDLFFIFTNDGKHHVISGGRIVNII